MNRHPGESRGPGSLEIPPRRDWIPASAGMTTAGFRILILIFVELYSRKEEKLMIKNKSLGLTLLLMLALVVFFAAGGNAADTKQKPKASKPAKSMSKEAPPAVRMELEPKAMDILKAVVTYESPSRLGTPLAYTTKSEVTLQRPDKLRVVTLGDGPASEFYYDGKTMTAFSPGENLVAVAEAPPTIDAALKAAYDSAAIYFPFTDVMVTDPYKDLSDGLILAFYIGQSNVVGGTTTDMVAFANDNVFAQIWIGTEDKLPRMIRAVYRTDAAKLRHQLELSNWQLDVAVPGDAFASTKAASAKPMPFAHPNAKRTQGDKPPTKGMSPKSN
jgi:hypothetical protein